MRKDVYLFAAFTPVFGLSVKDIFTSWILASTKNIIILTVKRSLMIMRYHVYFVSFFDFSCGLANIFFINMMSMD